MAKRTTTTEVVTKAMARSGPEITPSQIRLDDSVQTDDNKVFTQSDVNQNMGSGGGGGVAPDLKDYAKTDYVDSADNALNALIAANTKAIEDIEIPEGGESYDDAAIKKEISDLQDAFDTAVAAAQDGAENLEIELQSYAKKEDIPPSPNLTEYATKEALNSEASTRELGDNELASKIQSNTTQIQTNTAAIAALDTSGPDLSGVYTKPESDEKFATKTELLKEIDDREVVDGTLQHLLKIETDQRESADQALNELIAANTEAIDNFVPAPRLPGFTWTFKDYAGRSTEDEVSQAAAAVTKGEFTWNAENSTFYISCTSKCGIVLGTQRSTFNAYTIPAVMTIYNEDDGLCAFIKVSSVQVQNYGGQDYFRIVRGGYAKQLLNAGKHYNITLSGVF